MADLACCAQPRKSGGVVRKMSFGRKKKEIDLKDKATIGGLDRPSDLGSSRGSTSTEPVPGIMRHFSFGKKEKQKSDLSSEGGESSPHSPTSLMRHFSFGKKKEPKQADPVRAQSQFTALDFERNQSVRQPRETGADKVVRVLSFGRGRKARGAAAASKPQPATAADGATREANLALLQSADVTKGWLAVRLPEEYGGGGGREKLFAVFHQKAYRLRLFERADDAEFGRQGVADIIVAWARRGPRELKDLPDKPHDLHVWSDSGEQFECRLADPTAASEAQGHVQMWVDALNKARDEATTRGFVEVARPGKKGWKRRYMVYHARSQQLSLYACAAKDDERSAAMHAEQRGTLTVQHTAHHPSPAYPFMFRCYAADLASFELKCANGDQLRRWLNAMPIYTVSLGGGVGGGGEGGVSGGGNGAGGVGTTGHANGTGSVANGTGSIEREEEERVKRALLAEVASLKERLAQKAAATGPPPKAAKPMGGTSGGSGKDDASGDERSESRRSDDSDVDDDVEEVPQLQIGMSRADMMGSAAPTLTATERAAMASSVVRKELNLNEKSRRKLSTSLRKPDSSIAEEQEAAADAEGGVSPGKGGDEEPSGSGELDRRSQTMAMRKKVREEKAKLEQAIAAMQAMTEEMAGIEEEDEEAGELAELRREVAEATAMRARAETGNKGSDGGGCAPRKGSEGSAELERMRAELAEMQRREEQLQDENRKLKATTGGALSADDDAALRDAFVEQLGRILELRREGKFDQSVFDDYNAAMVQLSEEHIRDIYQAFMMIYVDEADEETLESLNIDPDDVDDATLGFAEMMSIKLGELMDQPRHVRVQAYQAQLQKKAEQEKERIEKAKREKEQMEAMAAQAATNKKIYEALGYVWLALQDGKGDEAEVKRFRRKAELKLLNEKQDALKRLSPYNWQNMSCNGLRPAEMRCLLHHLTLPGAPKHAEKFVAALRGKLGTKAPSDVEAIEARRAKAEARARAIEAGELAVEDPRERRLREQKEAEAKAKAEARAAKKAAKAGAGGETDKPKKGSLAEARRKVADEKKKAAAA